MLLEVDRLFDGFSWHGPSTIAVLDGVVRGVEAARAGRAPTGLTAVPGLIDAHVHLFPGYLQRLPYFGVTAAVDMFCTPGVARALCEESGAFFVTAGVGATVPGGHPHQLAGGAYEPFPSLRAEDSPEEFVRARQAEGSAFLKVFVEDGSLAGVALPTLSSRRLRDLCLAAHDHGMTVVAHAPTATTAALAIESGVDGLAHAVIAVDAVARADVVDALRARDVFVVTTLSATASLCGVRVADTLTASPIGALIGPRWRAYLDRLACAQPRRAEWEAALAFVAEANDRGVRLLAGTDAAFPGVVPGAALHCELELLTACGLDATAALRAATSAVAAAFDLGERGEIRPGAMADLVLLRGDPSVDVTATRRPASVIIGGASVHS